MYLSDTNKLELSQTARKLAQPGKGLLAADESTGTIKKRFDKAGIENTEQNRAAYRSLLFSSPGLGEYISGAILFEETLYQKNAKGESMVSLLKKQDIIPGIKVDKGLVNIPGTDEEKSTEGMDGLGKRCADYYQAGARFAKWRAALSIDPAKGKPSDVAIKNTTDALALYALICQANGLVPIVEPEILSDGSHSIEVCAAVTEKVLVSQYKALYDYKVFLPGTLLKPNMVTSGSDFSPKESPKDVGYYTVQALKCSVPPAVPGIMFLSGGQSEEEASLNLNAINQVCPTPWALSFSFGRALQASCIKTWAGQSGNTQDAQEALMTRAKANSQAQLGKYEGGSGGQAAKSSLFEKKYVY